MTTLHQDLGDSIGEEVFVSGFKTKGVKEATIFGPFDIFDLHVELSDHLEEIFVNDGIISAFHGVITPASVLPTDIGILGAYVIARDKDMACIIEASTENTLEDIMDIIQNLANGGESQKYEEIDIDNIYVLYGYELDVMFTTSEDEIDESAIAGCLALYDNLSKLKEEEAEG